MNARPSISVVTQAVDHAEQIARETAAASDMEKANMRGAAGLNFVLLCMAQAGRTVATDKDFQGLRVFLGTSDELLKLDADDAIVPAGFGPAVRSVQSGKLAVVAKALADAGKEISSGASPSREHTNGEA